jgi:ABC-type multidrug transport system fused ATPase/permease subunit
MMKKIIQVFNSIVTCRFCHQYHKILIKIFLFPWIRSRLAVIPQEPFLFSGSVRENVDPLNQYAESELWSALKRCHLDIVVSRLGGLEASVGDRGSLLSVGQQQLLCLARAVLHNAKVSRQIVK